MQTHCDPMTDHNTPPVNLASDGTAAPQRDPPAPEGHSSGAALFPDTLFPGFHNEKLYTTASDDPPRKRRAPRSHK